MATPLHDLQRLVASRQAISGRVVAIVTGGLVRVATAQGLVEVPGDGNLQVGDRVKIWNGKALKIQARPNTSLHYV